MYQIVLLLLCMSLVMMVSYLGTISAIRRNPELFRSSWWLHPNTVTLIRIPITIIVLFLYHHGYKEISMLLFACAIISDALDGLIARGCGLGTEWGKSLDPFADKIVYLFPLGYFTFVSLQIPIEILVIILLIDFFGQFSRPILRWFGLQTGANIYGKIKTVLIFAFVVYLFLIDTFLDTTVASTIREILLPMIVFFVLASVIFKYIPDRYYR